MTVQNTLALLQMFRAKGVTAARTPAGEKKTLAQLSQADLEAALRWQKS